MPFPGSLCCGNWFTNKTAFYNHRLNFHGSNADGLDSKTPIEQNKIQGSLNVENKENEPAIDGECISNNGYDIPQSEANTILSKAEDMNEEMITFCMRMLYECHISEVNLLEIMEFIKTITTELLSCFCTGRQQEQIMDHLFYRCASKYYIKNTLNNLVPTLSQIVGKFSYLPMKPQIKMLMEQSSIFRNAFHRSNLADNVPNLYQSPFDGVLVQKLLSKYDEDYIIPISLFFDEFTDVCPIGSFTSSNKKAVFQFKFVYHHRFIFPPKCFTLAIAPSSELSELITEDLNDVLYEAHEDVHSPFMVHGKTARVVIIFVNGDNLAEHQLAGLYQSFNAAKPCLKCLVPLSLFSVCTSEDEANLVRMRTSLGTEKQLVSISTAISKKDKSAESKKYGLTGVPSALLRIPSLAENFPQNILQDPSHDFLEGVGEYSIKYLLDFAMTNFKLKVEQINNAISLFNDKYSDRLEKYDGLPQPTFHVQVIHGKREISFRSTASRTKTLLTRMGIILHLTNISNNFFATDNWKCYTLCVQICSFLFSPVISESDCSILNSIVAQFLTLTCKLYGTCSIKPKFHHLIHYCNAIKKFGPSKHHSTLCHERSLGQLKDFVKSQNNAIKQIADGLKFQTLFFLFSLRPEYELNFTSVGSTKNLQELVVSILGFCPQNLVVGLPQEVRVFKQTIHRTCLFAHNLIICLSSPSPNWMGELPSFALIHSVFATNSPCSLRILIQRLQTVCYDTTLLGYKVIAKQEYRILNCSNLIIRQTFSVHTIGNTWVVIPYGLPYRRYVN